MIRVPVALGFDPDIIVGHIEIDEKAAETLCRDDFILCPGYRNVERSLVDRILGTDRELLCVGLIQNPDGRPPQKTTRSPGVSV